MAGSKAMGFKRLEVAFDNLLIENASNQANCEFLKYNFECLYLTIYEAKWI